MSKPACSAARHESRAGGQAEGRSRSSFLWRGRRARRVTGGHVEREAATPEVIDSIGGADGVRTRDLLRDRQAF